jgi:hypothetical protein
MLYRVVIGDAAQVRGIVEIDLEKFEIRDGTLVIYGPEATQVIGVWAANHWHSIVVVESWERARRTGVPNENPRWRQASR